MGISLEIYFGSGVELLIVSLAGSFHPNVSTVQNTSNCTANTAQYAAGKFKLNWYSSESCRKLSYTSITSNLNCPCASQFGFRARRICGS